MIKEVVFASSSLSKAPSRPNIGLFGFALDGCESLCLILYRPLGKSLVSHPPLPLPPRILTRPLIFKSSALGFVL